MYRFKLSKDGTTFKIWVIRSKNTKANTIIIKKGKRCIYKYRRKFEGQCEYELRFCFEFKPDHFPKRWFTTRKYDELHPPATSTSKLSRIINSPSISNNNISDSDSSTIVPRLSGNVGRCSTTKCNTKI